ncbi:RNA-directed DNA polymerase, partial [Bathymodiolus thermophilus thioautotrophic gill symbiont]
MRTVLDLTSDKAKAFFLDEENYCNVKLPSYFKFNDLLKAIDDEYQPNNPEKIYKVDIVKPDFKKHFKRKLLSGGDEWSLSSLLRQPLLKIYKYKTKGKYPSNFENINYKLFSNKDGKYAWRLFQLIHPVLYVSLVNYITNDWDTIKNAFDRFKDNKKIICASIPTANQKQQIDVWVKNVEQKSIELALEYEYLFKTDIVDCYGAIYTHSIPWAIHTKTKAKDKRNNKLYIGNIIDILLRGMNYGQTNGIPQGSVLMDFIAEMVLGYIDEELTKKLIECDDYRIIRYRDDYRIFTNDIATGKKIVKELSNILADMGMRLNDEKTKDSNDIVVSAIKADKMQVIVDNRPDSDNLQYQLLYIKNLSEQYLGFGQLIPKLK